MYKADRLTGIDLCRGLAAFAVVLVHSGDQTWGIPISPSAIQFTSWFNFAVPFFLAASFYFTTTKSALNISPNFWQKKFKRLIVPYLVWTAFYIILKSIIFLTANDYQQLWQLLADPTAIIFFGRASYHLYFIPLLFVGSSWLYATKYLIRLRHSILSTSILSAFSIVIYQVVLDTNNNFNLGSYKAFPELLNLIPTDNLMYLLWRVILVIISWLLKCLPYFLVAIIINQLLRSKYYKWINHNSTQIILLLIFLLFNIGGDALAPTVIREIIVAYSLLLFGISISQHLRNNQLINNLGLYSFGIYLIHPFVKSIVEIILVNILPQVTQSVSIISISVYAISSFVLSWSLISFISKHKLLARYI